MSEKQMRILAPSVRRFLSKPRTARLATVSPDGYPHVVPIWFMLDGNDIVFGSDRGEHKVKNARARPKGAVVIGGEPTLDKAGYLIVGDLSVEDDPGHKLMRRIIRRHVPKRQIERRVAEWGEGDMVIIRLKPRRVVRVW